VWLNNGGFRGFGCSSVAGDSYRLLHPPESYDEMMRNYELRRDKEFASHICATTQRQKISE